MTNHDMDDALADFAGGYETLLHTLLQAGAQAAAGKGHERHGSGLPWDEQPIFTVAGRHGTGFLTGQAEKKAGEARGMLRRGERAAAIRELRGAINYLAAAIQVIEAENGPPQGEGTFPADCDCPTPLSCRASGECHLGATRRGW